MDADQWAAWVQNGLAALALYFAVGGYKTWREERRDLRRAELAEQCLAAAYKVRDAFEEVRSRLGWSSEGADRKRGTDESPEVARKRDTAYASIERLNRHSALFEELISLRYSISAAFGPSAAKPLDEFLWARHQIIMAAHSAYDMAEYDGPLSPDDQQQHIKDRKIRYSSPGTIDDPLQPRIDKAIADLETAFRPYVEAKFRNPWRWPRN